MKRFKLIQSPFTPLILLIIIMCGYVIGAKDTKSTNVTETESTDIQIKESENSQVEEEASDTVVPRTDAETALENGKHISENILDSYAQQVIDDYCNRKVVACSSSNLQRYNETNLFRQTFDELTGYMNLVKLTSVMETSVKLQITTELENVTVALVFPDMTYVCLEVNEEITCTLPEGNSTILYIGKNLVGSIEANLEQNEAVTSKRM